MNFLLNCHQPFLAPLPKIIVAQAKRKIIIPRLRELGFELLHTSFVGLLSTGDFNERGFPFIPVFIKGSPITSTYIYLDIKKSGENTPMRITAKINTLFLSVRNVTFSKQLHDKS
jgi:hypothetical protein